MQIVEEASASIFWKNCTSIVVPNQHSDKSILVTGDSFCGIFNLFKLKDAKLEVWKIKGATLKGIFLLPHFPRTERVITGLTKVANPNRIAYEKRFHLNECRLKFGY